MMTLRYARLLIPGNTHELRGYTMHEIGFRGSTLAQDSLHFQRRLQILWVRHPVTDDGALEGHHGAPFRQRRSHFCADDNPVSILQRRLHISDRGAP